MSIPPSSSGIPIKREKISAGRSWCCLFCSCITSHMLRCSDVSRIMPFLSDLSVSSHWLHHTSFFIPSSSVSVHGTAVLNQTLFLKPGTCAGSNMFSGTSVCVHRTLKSAVPTKIGATLAHKCVRSNVR
jgi:hypothetical protein